MGNPFFGVFLHAIGGFSSASFYIPLRRIKQWAWESYWLAQGVMGWIIAPWVATFITTPNVVGVFAESPLKAIGWTYLYGVLWGIGALTFGLSMRYLGFSLGYALTLGFTLSFGTLMPPIYEGRFGKLAHEGYGQVILGGIVLSLIGLGLCAVAGARKERELTEEQRKSTVQDYSLAKGLLVAIFAGVLSACFAFGIAVGKPIAEVAGRTGTHELYVNNPVFAIIVAGGFTTNLIFCLGLNIKNRTMKDYVSGPAVNYFLVGSAGLLWYMQFFFYGMAETQMGELGFASFAIHMAFIIVFGNLWGILLFKEWSGAKALTRNLVWAGITLLVISTFIVGYGIKIQSEAKKPVPQALVDRSPGLQSVLVVEGRAVLAR